MSKLLSLVLGVCKFFNTNAQKRAEQKRKNNLELVVKDGYLLLRRVNLSSRNGYTTIQGDQLAQTLTRSSFINNDFKSSGQLGYPLRK